MTSELLNPAELLARLVDDDGAPLHDIEDVPHGMFIVSELRDALAPSGVVGEIAAERLRQINRKGWSADHDDGHVHDELALAAVCYASPRPLYDMQRLPSGELRFRSPWPWGDYGFKPYDRRRNLIRAAALIVAEIERLDRKGRS